MALAVAIKEWLTVITSSPASTPTAISAICSAVVQFETAQAVTPGQGQTVRVSGIRVGDIAKVDLEDGRAVITMDLDPKYSDLGPKGGIRIAVFATHTKEMIQKLIDGVAKVMAA